jgi:uncharacterized OB-fold protein
MGKLRDCPQCGTACEYPDGDEYCPECGYNVQDWWESRRSGLSGRYGIDEEDLE